MKIYLEMEMEEVAKLLMQHAKEYGLVNEHASLNYYTGEVMGDALICMYAESEDA